jgi:hypothetical protein
MLITCSSTAKGSIYRFYRSDENFFIDLKPLVPLLLASDADVVVGSEDGDPGLMLTVGPMKGKAEAEFLRRAEPHLAPGCPTVAEVDA